MLMFITSTVLDNKQDRSTMTRKVTFRLNPGFGVNAELLQHRKSYNSINPILQPSITPEVHLFTLNIRSAVAQSPRGTDLREPREIASVACSSNWYSGSLKAGG